MTGVDKILGEAEFDLAPLIGLSNGHPLILTSPVVLASSGQVGIVTCLFALSDAGPSRQIPAPSRDISRPDKSRTSSVAEAESELREWKRKEKKRFMEQLQKVEQHHLKV